MNVDHMNVDARAAIVIANLRGTGGAREREPYGCRRDADQNLDGDIAKDTAHENLLARPPPVAREPLSLWVNCGRPVWFPTLVRLTAPALKKRGPGVFLPHCGIKNNIQIFQ